MTALFSCLPLRVPSIAGGRDGHDGRRRSSSCGPACEVERFVGVNQPSADGDRRMQIFSEGFSPTRVAGSMRNGWRYCN
jgi:hypothetical protein